MNNLAIEGLDSQVIVLFDYIFNNKNKKIFIKMCEELNKNELANYLEYKLTVNEVIQKQNVNKGGTIVQYIQEANSNKKYRKNEKDEESLNKNTKNEETDDLNAFTFDIDAYQNKLSGIRQDLQKEGLLNEKKKDLKNDNVDINKTKEENNDNAQNNSIFKDAMNIEDKGKKNGKELFSDLKKLASTSPIKENKKSGKNKQIVQQKIKPKRTHKEVGEIEKRPKKGIK